MHCSDKLCFALTDTTVMVDLALKINYLSIYLSIYLSQLLLLLLQFNVGFTEVVPTVGGERGLRGRLYLSNRYTVPRPPE